MRALVVVSGVMLALRLVWVFAFPEIDSDAYGHFFIAIATRRDPTNLAVHWVWLPLFHFLVGALGAIGLSFRGVRVVNALLATIGPFLVHRAIRARASAAGGAAAAVAPRWTEDPAVLAAIALAIAPLPTILGQSAQPETLFVLLLIGAVHEAARERARSAGLFLGLACFVRYEAWGATLGLAICWALAWFGSKRGAARDRRWPPFAYVAIPATLVALYVLGRWWTDGRLLLFFRGTRDITSVQVGRTAWTFREIISFPVVLPLIVLGPTLALVPIGAAVAMRSRQDGILPLGLGIFLLLSYYTGASHSGERYLVSLVPFACIAIGHGIVVVGRRLGRPKLVAALALGLLAATTGWHLRRAAGMAVRWDEGLRAREAELDRLAR